MRLTLAILIIFAFLATFLPIEAKITKLRQKRAINPFMDSIGKRSELSTPLLMNKRYFDSLAGQSLGKRDIVFLPFFIPEEQIQH